MEKEFWKSRTFWTAFLGLIANTLVAILPLDYKPIIMSGITFATAILTVCFRWGATESLGFGKK